MGSVLSLVLATPIFGLALTLDPGVALELTAAGALAPAAMAAVPSAAPDAGAPSVAPRLSTSR